MGVRLVGWLPGWPFGFGAPGLASGGIGSSGPGPGVGVEGGAVGVSWTSTPGVAVGAVTSVTDDDPGVDAREGDLVGRQLGGHVDGHRHRLAGHERHHERARDGVGRSGRHADDRGRRDHPHYSSVPAFPPHPCP